MSSRNVCSLVDFPFLGHGAGRCPAIILELSCKTVRKGRLGLSTARWRHIGIGDRVAEAYHLKNTAVVARLLRTDPTGDHGDPMGSVEDPSFTVNADGGVIRGRHQGLSDDGQKVASRSWILNTHNSQSKVLQSYLATWAG